ncbi:MAG: hypothetical protein KC910_07465, partial [Candidatus Eremiobacteraeota bacterium]|nr:hypothetical protein [Candidatus Eremiobacteraeota bacterium]
MQIQSNRAFTPVQQANSRPSANQGTVDHCADPNWREWSEGLNALSTGWQNFGGLDPNQHTRVAVLDDFNSAHGFEMESALNRNGADTLRLNVNRQGQSRTAGIAASLEEVAARL